MIGNLCDPGGGGGGPKGAGGKTARMHEDPLMIPFIEFIWG